MKNSARAIAPWIAVSSDKRRQGQELEIGGPADNRAGPGPRRKGQLMEGAIAEPCDRGRRRGANLGRGPIGSELCYL